MKKYILLTSSLKKNYFLFVVIFFIVLYSCQAQKQEYDLVPEKGLKDYYKDYFPLG